MPLNRKVVCVHEAAHAVVYRSHEIQVVRVDISGESRRTRRGIIAGGCFARHTAASNDLSVYQSLAAGAAAERLLCGFYRDWDQRILDYVAALKHLDAIYAARGINSDLDAQERCELECWTATLELVWSRRDQILAVVKQLFHDGKLTGDDVDLAMTEHGLKTDTMPTEKRTAALVIKRPYKRLRC